MERLTPGNLGEFIQRAQRFLNLGPVDMFNDGQWYGWGRMTVEVEQLGKTLVATFNQDGMKINVAPSVEGYEVYYEITPRALLIKRTPPFEVKFVLQPK